MPLLTLLEALDAFAMPPHQKVLSTIKDGLVRYCSTKTSGNGVNNMWILKNSTSLLSSLDQLDVRTAASVQTFHFSTLYTSIPHDLLKSRISNLVHNAFRKKDGSVRYTHIEVTKAKGYFTYDINGSRDSMYLRLEKSFNKFYGRYHDLFEKYQRSVNVMVND